MVVTTLGATPLLSDLNSVLRPVPVLCTRAPSDPHFLVVRCGLLSKLLSTVLSPIVRVIILVLLVDSVFTVRTVSRVLRLILASLCVSVLTFRGAPEVLVTNIPSRLSVLSDVRSTRLNVPMLLVLRVSSAVVSAPALVPIADTLMSVVVPVTLSTVADVPLSSVVTVLALPPVVVTMVLRVPIPVDVSLRVELNLDAVAMVELMDLLRCRAVPITLLTPVEKLPALTLNLATTALVTVSLAVPLPGSFVTCSRLSHFSHLLYDVRQHSCYWYSA